MGKLIRAEDKFFLGRPSEAAGVPLSPISVDAAWARVCEEDYGVGDDAPEVDGVVRVIQGQMNCTPFKR